MLISVDDFVQYQKLCKGQQDVVQCIKSVKNEEKYTKVCLDSWPSLKDDKKSND